MPERPRDPREAAAFHEALSQWRLAARTEVRRSSSLPSSMFDANDPMLEARLAETVDAMLASLQSPPTSADDDEALEQRTEQVTPAELRALPRAVGSRATGGGDGEPDLDLGLLAEFRTLLIDACATGNAATAENAAALLATDLADSVDLSTDLTRMTCDLHTALAEALATDAGGAAAKPTAAATARLTGLCEQIAALLLLRRDRDRVRDRVRDGDRDGESSP